MPAKRSRIVDSDNYRRHWLSCFRLEPLDPERFDARGRHADFGGGVSVSCLSFGGPVEIEMQPLLTTYLVVLPTRGEVRISSGGSDALASPERAVVVDPADPHWQAWAANTDVLFVHLAAEGVCAAAGTRADAPPRLPGELDVRTDPGRGWRRVLEALVTSPDTGTSGADSDLTTKLVLDLASCQLGR
ncbi:hypothetical protein CU254_42170 (plasmid) [Amycolatopsis sp. AA4]|uniref:cupin domain-containing protein n=1 Tax=Actinomycetes TaxID=1760 RepID=UPI0001B566E1|nr:MULTISPECIES: hypothetical protein [Actinomycetes]ATY17182.1 hypothetical protein CU254_42170 [Amycolatopsis sp. AA4]